MLLSCAVLKIQVSGEAIADVLLVGLAACLCPAEQMELLVHPRGLCWKVLGKGSVQLCPRAESLSGVIAGQV